MPNIEAIVREINEEILYGRMENVERSTLVS